MTSTNIQIEFMLRSALLNGTASDITLAILIAFVCPEDNQVFMQQGVVKTVHKLTKRFITLIRDRVDADPELAGIKVPNLPSIRSFQMAIESLEKQGKIKVIKSDRVLLLKDFYCDEEHFKQKSYEIGKTIETKKALKSAFKTDLNMSLPFGEWLFELWPEVQASYESRGKNKNYFSKKEEKMKLIKKMEESERKAEKRYNNLLEILMRIEKKLPEKDREEIRKLVDTSTGKEYIQ